jgi:hypothetical protein
MSLAQQATSRVPSVRRIHVFVGIADSPLAARQAAHDAYDAISRFWDS